MKNSDFYHEDRVPPGRCTILLRKVIYCKSAKLILILDLSVPKVIEKGMVLVERVDRSNLCRAALCDGQRRTDSRTNLNRKLLVYLQLVSARK